MFAFSEDISMRTFFMDAELENKIKTYDKIIFNHRRVEGNLMFLKQNGFWSIPIQNFSYDVVHPAFHKQSRYYRSL